LEPAAGDTQNRAQQADRIGGAVGGDEGELRFHAFSAHLAKKAEAFRRISFSSWSRLLSRRSCCSSTASTLRRATASADPAACCSSRQVFTCIAATPSAWATLLSVSPGSSNRATAAALNSAVYRLRVFFVMAFFQMVSEFNIWSGLAGQGHMADHLRSSLCENALMMAIQHRAPPRGLIHHSDRGVQGGFKRSSQQPDEGVADEEA